MKNIIISTVAGLSLLAGVAILPVAANAQSCASISTTLSMGSRGSQVSALQQFLVSQSYPGGGSWMVTGYYGQATAAAVRIFQQQHGLSQTGVVDSATLSAMQNCGTVSSSYTYPGYPGYTSYPSGTSYPYNYTYPYNYNYNYNNYPYNYNYGYGTPTITSLSQNTGTAGQSVTIYGQGFSPFSNTINFGSQIVPGVVSSNGTSLTFTIPYTYSYVSNQSIQLSVSGPNGTSNSVTFTLNPNIWSGYNYGCGYNNGYPYNYNYNYGNCGTCGGYYTYNCQGNVNAPTITYLTPQFGGVGTVVTVYGSGFTTSNNTVHFGNGILTGLQSPDGQSLSFVVPSTLTGYGSQPLVLGTYNVSVTNSNNATTNVMQFTVTSTGNTNGGAPTITSVSGPTNLTTGQQGTWTMQIGTQGNTYTTVSASWGDTGNGYVNMAAPTVIYNSQTVTFTHAYINPGTYTLTFTVANQNGQSNSYTSTIYVSGNGYQSGAPTVSYLSPSSGYVGTQVTIYGSNFSTYGSNTIYFGTNGAIQNAYSNGNSITFTIPSYTQPYCTPGLYCGVQPTPVTHGTYNVSVMNQWGTSNTVTFTVL